MNKCRVEFVYDALEKPFPVGVTFDLRTLVLVKRQILREAEQEYKAVRHIDEALSIEHYGNLKRLRDTLDFLIPPELETLVLSQDGVEAEGA